MLQTGANHLRFSTKLVIQVHLFSVSIYKVNLHLLAIKTFVGKQSFLEGKSNQSLELRGVRQIIVPEQLVVHNANARLFIHFIRVQSLPQFAQRV